MRNWKLSSKLFLFAATTLLLSGIALTWFVPRTAASPQTVHLIDASWNIVASGGATMNSPSYILQGTLGQPVIGEFANSNFTLVSGYWADLRVLISEFYLTLIRGS